MNIIIPKRIITSNVGTKDTLKNNSTEVGVYSRRLCEAVLTNQKSKLITAEANENVIGVVCMLSLQDILT